MKEYEWRILFADRLRDIMECNNMSIREFSIKTGVGEKTLSGYLSLDKTPSINMILKICDALGCTMDKLVV